MREPEVYADSMGEDSSTLYVPTARYPTRVGALRAIHRSLWFTEATNDGWDYVHAGTTTVSMHPHGPDEGTYDDDGRATCCGPEREAHVFVVSG